MTNSSTDNRTRQIYRVTIIGSVFNGLLVAMKFVAGVLGNSAAMIADAVHSLSDFITDIVVLIFAKIASKPQDPCHDYGHGKYETLSTTIIGIMLFGAGIGIFWNGATAIWDYLNGATLERPGMLALIAAIVSIVVKELLYQYTAYVGRKVNSQSVVANAWHHRSDAFSSIGTMVGIGGAILLGDKWIVLDPLAAVVVSFFIVNVAYKLIVPSLGELTEKSLPEEVEKKIEEALLSIQGVTDPHNMRTRKIGNRHSVDVHVRMDGNLSVNESHETSRKMEQRVREILGEDTFVSIHIEPIK